MGRYQLNHANNDSGWIDTTKPCGEDGGMREAEDGQEEYFACADDHEVEEYITTLESKLAERDAEVGRMRLSHEVWQQHSDADIAKLFHEHYECIAPDFGYETREESRTGWSNLTSQMRGLMITTVTSVRHVMVDKAYAALTPTPEEKPHG